MRITSLFRFLLLPAVLGAAGVQASPADYRLAERDLIEMQVFNQPDLSVSQRVTTSGELRLPLTGTVNVAGMPLRGTEEELESRYKSGRYLVSPQVILAVVEYGARSVSVLGEVQNPVRIEFPPEQTSISVVQAITEAGGFTRVARANDVQIIRNEGQRGEERIVL